LKHGRENLPVHVEGKRGNNPERGKKSEIGNKRPALPVRPSKEEWKKKKRENAQGKKNYTFKNNMRRAAGFTSPQKEKKGVEEEKGRDAGSKGGEIIWRLLTPPEAQNQKNNTPEEYTQGCPNQRIDRESKHNHQGQGRRAESEPESNLDQA
jgi:hypothetical protein